MRTTEIPPTLQQPPGTAEVSEVPVLLLRLQDDLTRSRRREAFWMSLALHLLVLIALITSPQWAAFAPPVRTHSAEELIRGKELTYLDLPHDRQKVEKPPETSHLSDKNRIATRRPTVDRKTLDDIRDSARPGPPGPPAGPPSQAPTAPSQFAQAQPGQQSQAESRPAPQTQARLESPLMPAQPNFGASLTPGQAIQQAARAAAAGRVGGTVGGSGGDYGTGSSGSGRIDSDLDILSDTMGVDFGPYLSRVLHDVRINWYNLIPEVARPPLLKKGKVAITFVILKDGKIAGLQLAGGSGDVSLDRAAWGGIQGSNPFPPLPGEFRGPYLALRFHFYYNPDKRDLQ
jgi:TonB family protein